MTNLPIEAALPALISALRTHGRAVLEAPPGAGKTTRVPLAILESGLLNGRLILLEPRRLATRAAALRMAESLGETPGQTIGYRMRGESEVSSATKIEVVTEGILTRMIQSDPALEGVSAVIFDEFHERSLHADLGLALTWQIKQALRSDLLLLVMSATLDAGPIAAFLDDAPRITAEGRAFPVEVIHLPRPLDRSLKFEGAMAALIRQAFAETEGHLLAFLPGEGEIHRTAAQLSGLPVETLYGAMPFKAQRAVLAPSKERKIILTTSIAETSLTIDGVRCVIDGGLARRAAFDPATGMSRLVTGRVTKAEAVQRQGRAGRQAPGWAYKLWSKAEEGALAAYPAPEIEAGDLSALALELAMWGDERLSFLTPPDPARLTEARTLLVALGAVDTGRITDHGRAMAALPVHPRLAHLLLKAGKAAAPLAALLSDRDPMRDAGPDLMVRLEALKRPATPDLKRIADEARRLTRTAPDRPEISVGLMAALAFPDRIAQRREASNRFLLSGGKGATLDQPAFPNARYLVVTESDGNPREAKIRTALPVDEADLRTLGPSVEQTCFWSAQDQRVRATRQERLGALVLSERPLDRPDPETVKRALCQGIRQLCLPHSEASRALQARLLFLYQGPTDDDLLATLEDWLAPFLTSQRTAADLKSVSLLPALQHLAGARMAELDRLAPAQFTTPLGRHIRVDYEGDHPKITLRLQEMFGVTTHPVVGRKHLPLRVELLSPGGKPIQVTMDVPGFWRTSYAEVRKDMRGRYPRHPWPEDPWNADPTLRAKPRGQ